MSRAPLALWLLLGTLGMSLVALGVANDLDRASDPRLMARDDRDVQKLHRFHFAPSEAVTIRAVSLSQPAAQVSFEEVISPAKSSTISPAKAAAKSQTTTLPTIPKLVQTPIVESEPQPLHGAVMLMPSFVNPTKVAAAAERKKSDAVKPAAKKPAAAATSKAKQPVAAAKEKPKQPVAATTPKAKKPELAKPQPAVTSKSPIVLYPAEPLDVINRYELKRIMRRALPGDQTPIERHLEFYGKQGNEKFAAVRIPVGEVSIGPNRVAAKVTIVRRDRDLRFDAFAPAAMDGRLILFQGVSTLYRLQEGQANEQAATRKQEGRPTAVQKRLLEFIDGAEQRIGDLVRTTGLLGQFAEWLNRRCDESFYQLSVRVRNELWQGIAPATTSLPTIRSAGRPNGGKL